MNIRSLVKDGRFVAGPDSIIIHISMNTFRNRLLDFRFSHFLIRVSRVLENGNRKMTFENVS